jgi:hypothetical protein
MLKRLTNGEFVLAMLAASLFWIVVVGWATSYAPTDPQKDACYQSAAKSGRNIDECKSFWEKATSDPIAAFTFVLAISTVGLWIATIGLYFAGERQLAHLQKSSERQLGAFVFAKALGVTPETITKAYTTTQGTWEQPVSWVVAIMWENSGDTRTKNLFIHVSYQFFDGEMPEDFSFPDLGDQTRILTMIGPRATIASVEFKFEASDPRALKVFEGKTHLYLWGWAEYDDIFEGTPRHRTEFCYEIFFVGAAFPGKAQLAHRMHRLHNAADEDCKYPLKTQRT